MNGNNNTFKGANVSNYSKFSSYRNNLNEGITMCLEIKYYNISIRQHNLIIYL